MKCIPPILLSCTSNNMPIGDKKRREIAKTYYLKEQNVADEFIAACLSQKSWGMPSPVYKTFTGLNKQI